MISRLQGILIEKQPPLLVIDVHGVGYEVFAPMSVSGLSNPKTSLLIITIL